jgi:enamine deaminase RidA (YjgF/YER057c/UK114 family)
MLNNYQIFRPATYGTIFEEWLQCRDQILQSAAQGHRPLKLSIFVNVPDYPAYVMVKEQISRSVIESFSPDCPAFSITIHPPERPVMVAVEGLFISGSTADVKTRFLDDVPYVVMGSGRDKEVWGAGLGSDLSWEDTRKAGCAAFDKVNQILAAEGLSLNNIVRQWNYIGNILGISDGYQNYQIFNEVRSEYYGKYRNVPYYPAATGIGMKYGGVFLDFYAVSESESVKIRRVENPNQMNAYEYGQQVLKGLPWKNRSSKHPPQFERALLVVNNHGQNLFISGTASIIGQETIGKGDVREQTIVTIENIRKLTDVERINQLSGDISLEQGRFVLIRVYIKDQNDFGTVKEICSEHFPDLPAVYIESDICRADLLTEIEAEYMIR